jgi:hypothetical protein
MRERIEAILARADICETQRMELAKVLQQFEKLQSAPHLTQGRTITYKTPVPEAVSRFTGQIPESSVNNSVRFVDLKATLEDAFDRRTQALQLLDGFETQLEASGLQDLDKRIASTSQKFDMVLRS